MALWKRGRTYWADVTVNGQRYRESLKTRDVREARNREKELVSRISGGKAGPPASQSFARLPLPEAAEKFLAEREHHLAPRSIEREREALQPLVKHFGQTPLVKITAERIRRYQRMRKQAGKKNATVNGETGFLSRILRRAKLWAAIADDYQPFPAEPSIGRAPTAEEKARLFATAESNPAWFSASCAAILSASTSCRTVELRHLQWKDVDLFGKLLTIERSKRHTGRRTIPLNRDALAVLGKLRERAEALGTARPEHYVFPGHVGRSRRLDPNRPMRTWKGAWRSLRAAAGLPWLRFHDLRHCLVTELAEAGASDATIKAIAGHVSQAMLERYSHVRLEAKRAALEKLSLTGKPQRLDDFEPEPETPGEPEPEKLQ